MRQAGFRVLILCVACLAFLSSAIAQDAGTTAPLSAAANQTQNSPTFHAESRIVVVDVVVTKHREPVTGLTQSDFQVLEDGKRQQIQFFESHIPSSSTPRELALARQGSMNQEFFDHMSDFLAETTAARDQDRAKITLQALQDISRAVSGFRGRKNVIWLSEEFPVYFGPQMNASDPSASARNY